MRAVEAAPGAFHVHIGCRHRLDTHRHTHTHTHTQTQKGVAKSQPEYRGGIQSNLDKSCISSPKGLCHSECAGRRQCSTVQELHLMKLFAMFNHSEAPRPWIAPVQTKQDVSIAAPKQCTIQTLGPSSLLDSVDCTLPPLPSLLSNPLVVWWSSRTPGPPGLRPNRNGLLAVS